MNRYNYFIEIPAGEATIGLDPEVAQSLSTGTGEVFEALPPTKILVNRFLLQVRPVTWAEYYEFLIKHPSIEPPPVLKERSLPETLAEKPVTMITWFEALAYAQWIGARLPTEVEWEYAARGLDQRPYPWGWEMDKRIRHKRSLPCVGRYPDLVSPFGLQDMIGLVSEWTLSRYRRWRVARGCPYCMHIFHAARRFLLQPLDRWACTGFRCAKDIL